MNSHARNEAPAQCPGTTTVPGHSCFLALERMANRTPRAFTASLLSPEELDRVRALLWGPQCPVALDNRLLNLGLARIVLGKVVATRVAWEGIWQQRFEIRRGNDKRPLQVVETIEVGSYREALAMAWKIARREVRPQWQARLVQEGNDPCWTISVPPPRLWAGCSMRPYFLEIRKQTP